jgi:hypothetical protein
MPRARRAMPRARRAMPRAECAMPHPERAMPHPDRAMPHPERAMPRAQREDGPALSYLSAAFGKSEPSRYSVIKLAARLSNEFDGGHRRANGLCVKAAAGRRATLESQGPFRPAGPLQFGVIPPAQKPISAPREYRDCQYETTKSAVPSANRYEIIIIAATTTRRVGLPENSAFAPSVRITRHSKTGITSACIEMNGPPGVVFPSVTLSIICTITPVPNARSDGQTAGSCRARFFCGVAYSSAGEGNCSMAE